MMGFLGRGFNSRRLHQVTPFRYQYPYRLTKVPRKFLGEMLRRCTSVLNIFRPVCPNRGKGTGAQFTTNESTVRACAMGRKL